MAPVSARVEENQSASVGQRTAPRRQPQGVIEDTHVTVGDDIHPERLIHRLLDLANREFSGPGQQLGHCSCESGPDVARARRPFPNQPAILEQSDVTIEAARRCTDAHDRKFGAGRRNLARRRAEQRDVFRAARVSAGFAFFPPSSEPCFQGHSSGLSIFMALCNPGFSLPAAATLALTPQIKK